MSWLGRNALIGLGVGVTISTGLIALLIIKEALRRRNLRLLHSTSSALLSETDSAAVRDLSPEQQVELRKTLDAVMKSVSSLRNEISELREGLSDISTSIAEDVKKTVEESQRSWRRRRRLMPRERSESMSSSSIYFSASAGVSSLCDDSEVGYSTAYSNAESDYTDRETDKEGEDDGRDSDEEEEESCVTVLRQDDSQAEEEDDEDDGLMVDSLTDIPSPELTLLLAQCDLLHAGDSGKKTEGFQLLMENRPLVSSLDCLERKTAGTIYETPPTSSVNEALKNFLKAEELNPGFSKTVRLYIAKCHKELGNESEARNWVHLALSTPAGANEDSDSAALQEELKALIDSKTDL
ncbi:regulator of microtubule dynamics protein 3-like isoform X2 [Cyprinus carpio]|uniref:Regulator of microtubule dynamics protein 3-like isoform X2 n=1 Tax=Cyprinus carpio TaxID=7962 RepID=A0A9Q9Z900_CYPCA|nr:regulator of microtubule dynamics protein 3-like isoform X2 [Cyprinus carpio]